MSDGAPISGLLLQRKSAKAPSVGHKPPPPSWQAPDRQRTAARCAASGARGCQRKGGALRTPRLVCPSLFCPSLFCPSLFCPSLFCPSLFCPSLFCPSLF